MPPKEPRSPCLVCRRDTDRGECSKTCAELAAFTAWLDQDFFTARKIIREQERRCWRLLHAVFDPPERRKNVSLNS